MRNHDDDDVRPKRRRPAGCLHLLLLSLFSATACAADAADDTSVPVTESLSQSSPRDLEALFTREHDVPVGHGRRIHLRETFTWRSLSRHPRRAIVMISGAVANGDLFNFEGHDGYDARDMMARRGFFAFTADPEGTGASTFPASGFSVTYDREARAFAKVIDYIRLLRHVPKVDVLGESDGGGIAAELCADDHRVRSCSLSSMLYRRGTPFFEEHFNSPEFRAFLLGSPRGYLTTVPESYEILLMGSDPVISAWVKATQPGPHAVGTMIENFDLPSYDPTRARVPGLVIHGDRDQNVPLSDNQELAAAYGRRGGQMRGASLVVISGAMHVPRLEPPPQSDRYWSAVTNFVDP